MQKDLEFRVLELDLVPQTRPELNAANRLVTAFLRGAGASGQHEVNWSAERAHQALRGLKSLIRQKYEALRLPPQYTFRTITLPVEPRPMPTDIADRYDKFERGRWYTGWTKSILPLVSFDAKTTEYELANIMDNNPKIKWWLRLQLRRRRLIQLDAGGKYYPDFIAIDVDDVSWIIEGKSDDGALRRTCRRKRQQAKAVRDSSTTTDGSAPGDISSAQKPPSGTPMETGKR